jgi:hypothetical protein
LAAVTVVLGAAACEGIGPGDYLVYRIAFQDPVLDASCYAGGQIPVDDEQDTSNQFTAGTWVLYMGPDERAYLDLGTTTLRGTGDSESFVFDGNSTDVNVVDDGMGGMRTETRIISTNVTFNVTGAVVEGVIVQSESFSCAGEGCPENFNCTRTSDFVGGEVEDVELSHEV